MSDALLLGKTLCSRYRIDAPIRSGAMGAVYRATDLQLDREVAVKVVLTEERGPEVIEKLRARLRREGEAIARIRHPHVVRCFAADADVETRTDFLVMELLRGEDLRTRLARAGALPLRVAVRVLYQAARGLGAVHRSGMVHRDFKPPNLFLEQVDGPGQVRARVLDFGAVQLLGDGSETIHQLTVHEDAPHTPAYAAPEQLRHQRDVRAPCDVFALGVTAFQAIAGVHPFSWDDRVRMGRGEDVRPPSLRAHVPAVSPLLDDVIGRAMAGDPRLRHRHGDEFASALRDAMRPQRAGTWDGTRAAADRTATPDGRTNGSGAGSAPPPPPDEAVPDAGSTGGYPPIRFWTDVDEEAIARDPGELAELMARNPRRGELFLYERGIEKLWKGVNDGLCVALAGIARDYAENREAGLACAIYTLDRHHPYREARDEVTSLHALADHLLRHGPLYRSALRVPTHRLWLYLGTRRDPAVRDGMRPLRDAFSAAADPASDGGRAADTVLHRLVVWLRARDGETRMEFAGAPFSAPRELAALDAGGRTDAASILSDPSSLLAAWVVSRDPGLGPRLERWRAAGADAAILDQALGFGIRVGDGEVLTPRDAVAAPLPVMVSLWIGREETRERVDAYLRTFYDVPLALAGFAWLRDENPDEPHAPDVADYAAREVSTLLARLGGPGGQLDDATVVNGLLEAAARAGQRPGEQAALEQVEALVAAAESWMVLARDILPVLLRHLPDPDSEGRSALWTLAATAQARLGVISFVVPVRLHRLALWLAAAARALDRAPPGSAEATAWHRLLERMNDGLAEAYRTGYREVAEKTMPLYTGDELVRHALAEVARHGVRLPLLERWREEDAVHRAHAAVIEERMGPLRQAAGARLRDEDAAALEKRRRASNAVAELRGERADAMGMLLVMTLGTAAFFYCAPVLWYALADAAAVRPVWPAAMEAIEERLDETVRYIVGAYFPPLFTLAMCFGTAGIVGAGIGGMLVIASLIWFPAGVALAAPFLALALLYALVRGWTAVTHLSVRIAMEREAVSREPAYVAECQKRRAASDGALRDQQIWCSLAARRTLVLAEDPAQVRAPSPGTARPVRAAPGRRAWQAVHGWIDRHPRRAANGALLAVVLALVVIVPRRWPDLPFWLTARFPHYVLLDAFSEDDRDMARARARELRALPGLRDARVLRGTRYSDDGWAVVLGPYDEARAEREAEVASHHVEDASIHTASELNRW